MEMTLFRSKNVFFIAYTLFFLLRKTSNNGIDIKNLESFRICWLKSEISEVSAHLDYFLANFKDIQF